MKTKEALDWFYDKTKSHFEHDGDLLETFNFTFAIAKDKEKQSMQDYADEQAVAFTEWVSFCVFSGMYFEHRTEYGIYFDSKTLNKITTAELLEIFKKEQQ